MEASGQGNPLAQGGAAGGGGMPAGMPGGGGPLTEEQVMAIMEQNPEMLQGLMTAISQSDPNGEAVQQLQQNPSIPAVHDTDAQPIRWDARPYGWNARR